MRRWVGASGAVVVLAAVVALTGPGRSLARAVLTFLEFYTGVFALVALSLTVMGGFLATDRIVLLVRHRVMLQSVHRLTGLLAAMCLALHIALKVAEGHARVVDVVVPFLSDHRRFFVGLGTIAAYLMGALIWTGFIRGRFASGRRPWVWRLLHISAYPAWVIAIVHGLGSGRPAATWVTVSYILCLVAVGLGAVVRLSVERGRRHPGTITSTGTTVKAAAVTVTTTGSLPKVPVRPSLPGSSRVPASSRVPVGRRRVSDEEFWRRMRGGSAR